MLQSSGLGNSINALTSLLVPYQIPALIVISMRGDAGEWNAGAGADGPRGARRSATRSALPHDDGRRRRRRRPTRCAGRRRRRSMTRTAGVCLLPRRMTVPAPKVAHERDLRGDATCRSPPRSETIRSSRASATRRTTCSPPAIATANFYTWGSMGLASSIGLGLAMAQPERRVFVLDGDGSLLMNLGSLATIGWVRPANLVVVVVGQRAVRHDRRPGHGDGARRRPRSGGARDGDCRDGDGAHAGGARRARSRGRGPKPGRGSSSPRSKNRRRR